MIDKLELNKGIREAASLYLSDIKDMSESELKDNLRYFAEKSKIIAESILEQYVFSNFEKYTEGKSMIKDNNVLSRFCDLEAGYQPQMLNWIEQNKLEVREEEFELPKKNENYPSISPSPKAVLTGGTIVAIGLFIFTNIWIALAAEILTIAFAKIQQRHIQKSALQRKLKQEHYEAAIEVKKNQLVNGMIAELEKWLDLGEAKSNEILSSYNI